MRLFGRIVTLVFFLITIVVAAGALALSLHGRYGNPSDQELLEPAWREHGPFELSPERGRYALTYSLVEHASYTFSPYLAAFTIPDVGYLDGRFVSLFPPGLSYVVMPGYIIGNTYNLAQIGTFASIAIIALINLFLVYRLSRFLGAHPAAALIAGLIFLFGTPAYAYASTLYQHHVTTFLLLTSILMLAGQAKLLKLALVWIMAGTAFVVDSPNAIFFLPIAIASFTRVWTITKGLSHYEVRLHISRLLAIGMIVIPISLLMYFNTQSYGHPLKLGGTVPIAKDVTLTTQEDGTVIAQSARMEARSQVAKTPVAFFKTRNSLNGLYELFLSMDRGTLFFTPVIFFGLLGLIHIQRLRDEQNAILSLMLVTISVIVVLYATWGDPYGGWAFGSRYLIPAYALFAPFVALALSRYRRNIILLLLFTLFALYSIGVNTVGAVTTNMNPPKTEILALLRDYGVVTGVGYLNNITMLSQNVSKSFIYSTYAKGMMPLATYAFAIGACIAILIIISLIWLAVSRQEEKHT